jgi:gliding motility-associated-like protein
MTFQVGDVVRCIEGKNKYRSDIPILVPGELYPFLSVTEDEIGCSDSYSIIVTVLTELDVHIPNVFTPNNDLVNDYFGIKTSQSISGKVSIFNRWGGLMNQQEFTTISDEFIPLWDGQFAGQQATEGVYFYTLELTDEGGESHSYEGFMQLHQ